MRRTWGGRLLETHRLLMTHINYFYLLFYYFSPHETQLNWHKIEIKCENGTRSVVSSYSLQVGDLRAKRIGVNHFSYFLVYKFSYRNCECLLYLIWLLKTLIVPCCYIVRYLWTSSTSSSRFNLLFRLSRTKTGAPSFSLQQRMIIFIK